MKPIVLVVDDMATNLLLASRYLEEVVCEVMTAESGEAALSMMESTPPDLVLLDIGLPGLDGFEVCRRIKAQSRLRLTPVVMLTARSSTPDRVRALEAGADDFLVKPVDRLELIARVRSMLRLKAVYDDLQDTEQVLTALARAVEAKDSYTEAHTERVARNALNLGQAAGMDEAELRQLFRGGLIHDIGKIGVPDAVLTKPGPLDAAELEIMRRHPEIGEKICNSLRSSATVRAVIRHHHEHWNGSGYPDGLAGDEIPLAARVVAVCDAFDAMTSDRSYRRGMRPAAAISILREGAGTQWDPHLVEAFIALVDSKSVLSPA